MSQLRKSLDAERYPVGVVVAAGAVAGLFEIGTTYPLDTIKTQMQLNPRKYSSTWQAGCHIVRTTGPASLLNGLPASLAQVGGKVSLRFTVFDHIKQYFADGSGRVSASGNLLSGVLAGGVEAVLWTAPTERLKVLQQKNAGVSRECNSLLADLRVVVRTQGLAGLWVGTEASIYKQAISVGTRFWLYDVVKASLAASASSSHPNISTVHTLMAGAFVGAFSAVAAHPFDVVKSRMQAELLPRGHAAKYSGTWPALRLVVAEDGVGALLKGLEPRIARVAIAQAVTFGVYESALKLWTDWTYWSYFRV